MTSVTTAPPPVRRRLRTTMLWALLPLCGLLLVAGVTQLQSARAVHRDVLRLFEELRELALARSLVDELRGMQHWLEAALPPPTLVIRWCSPTCARTMPPR